VRQTETGRVGWIVWLAVLIVLGTGCANRELIQTPNLFLNAKIDPFQACPPEARNNRVEILYATDRLPVDRKGGGQEYGYQRSASLAFGRCTVEIGNDVPWPVLEKNSRVQKRDVPLPLSVQEILEIGRFPATPIPFTKIGKDLVEDSSILARNEQVAGVFRNEVSRRLAETPCKEAFVFVHGYNNTFEDSVFVMAELWHFLGRKGLPIVYTWPAGRGGRVRGYNYDRESGEFTIHHLKNFLRILASCPEIEKIHCLAHSRGTDVLSSAMRELIIEARAAGKNPRKEFKIADFTLAAPDLDMDVFTQRMMSERLGMGLGRITMYVSEEDKALGFSSWLFAGIQRVGRLAFENLTQDQKKRLSQVSDAAIVDARVNSGFIGHSYFYSDPAVSSDLILMMGYGRAPGASNGRPLIPVGPNFWRIEKGYPYRDN
jgi:esterase/lipase superfamily enzyme